jgi:hypothetical protein
VVIVASVVTARRVRGAAARAWLPAAFAAMHLGWGIGSIIGAVAGLTGRGPRQRGDPPVPLDRSANAESGPEQLVDGGNTSGEPNDDGKVTKVRRIA